MKNCRDSQDLMTFRNDNPLIKYMDVKKSDALKKKQFDSIVTFWSIRIKFKLSGVGPTMAVHPMSMLRRYPPQSLILAEVHPRKLTCPRNRDYFSREYIFQPLVFRGHVSFQGSRTLQNLCDFNVHPKLGNSIPNFLRERISEIFRLTNLDGKAPPKELLGFWSISKLRPQAPTNDVWGTWKIKKNFEMATSFSGNPK